MKNKNTTITIKIISLILAVMLCFGAAAPVVAVAADSKTSSSALHVHKYSAWKVTKKATFKKAGQQVRSCTACGKKQTRTIARIKSAAVNTKYHNYTGKAITAALLCLSEQ